MKQFSQIFSMNPARYNQVSIDIQINDYLKEHPDYKVSSVSYAGIGQLEKALVVFDIIKMPDELKRVPDVNKQNTFQNHKKSS